MIVYQVNTSPTFGGSGVTGTTPFDDYNSAYDSSSSMKKLEISCGWVVDGIKITYVTRDGTERSVSHGTIYPSQPSNTVTLSPGEYISKVEGIHGHPNGWYDYGDCIQKIRFTIKNGDSERVTPYYGEAANLPPANAVPFSWIGRLHSLAGLEVLNSVQVGLKGLACNELGNKFIVADSAPYGGAGRSSELKGDDYDDVAKFGSKLNFDRPIKSIEVWSGPIVHGIQFTYNLTDGTVKAVMHGAQAGNRSEVVLQETESIVKVKGLHGISFPDKDWRDQVQQLQFTMYDSPSDLLRTTATFGTGEELVQETRKDIYVRGRLVGVAGTANNSLQTAGLNTIKFYTLPPSSKSPK